MNEVINLLINSKIIILKKKRYIPLVAALHGLTLHMSTPIGPSYQAVVGVQVLCSYLPVSI